MIMKTFVIDLPVILFMRAIWEEKKKTINWIQLVLLMTDLHRWLSADGPPHTYPPQ